jgi:DeoR/GlpR family transcriptional regulator of sugar metabolism
VLADSSKIGLTALARSGTLADVDFFITDHHAPAATLRLFARQGPRIITVEPRVAP